MSANLDLVRSIHAAWERGDYTSVDWAHPDIEYVFADGPHPGSWRGVAAMAEGARDVLSAWEGFGVEAEEYRELDDEHVLVLQRYRGRGKTSRLDIGELRTHGASVFCLRDGKITKLVRYFDGERALADVGLGPEAGSSRE
jgi:ketosteroid isomerase-like protein